MERNLLLLLPCWFLFLLSLPYLNGTVINLENGGYTGIVVAVRNTIKEDLTIIDNIKELFTNASEFLHTATRGQAYFREVTIAIPSTWSSQKEYEIVLSNYFSSAHIRIDTPNPEYGNTPYTLQAGGCGEPGEYIHLTPEFIRNKNGDMSEKFGPPARQLVHEWAHLRYGVFDEYGIPGDPRFPMFYHDSGKVYPTSCIKDIKGWIESKNGGPCSILESGFVDKDCIFIPDMHHQDVPASIMYMPFIPSMDGFCDKTDERFHNIRAPTRQNAICQYKSTWKVIASHPDFSQQNRTKRQVLDFTNTRFRLVKQQNSEEGRFVLVLDVSGSMSGQPMQLLYQSATRFVQDRIPNGSYLGIVQFSTFAQILHNLTKVTDESRLQLSSSLPNKDDAGTTAIGRGLAEAILVLKNYTDNSIEGGIIILISDGEENVSPLISEVFPMIIKEKVIVNTVAFGKEASIKLENVTKATGGKGFFFGDLVGKHPSSDLDAAFLESVTSHSDIDFQPVKITDEMVYIRHDDKVRKNIWLDEELGKNTVFTFLSPRINEFNVSIRDPMGKVFDSFSPEYNKDTGPRQRVQFTISNAKSGPWLVVLQRQTHLNITVSITLISEPKDVMIQPVRVKSWISDFQLKLPAYAKIYAEVKKGYQAVINAKVVATVDRPMGKPVDIILKDDGAGADILANDGIYTAYFTQFNGNGRYAVVANVVNDGQAKLKNGFEASPAIPIPKFFDKNKSRPKKEPSNSFPVYDFVPVNTTEDIGNETEPLPEMQRTSETGAFRVENWEGNFIDVTPPGNVNDLIVLSAHSVNKTRYALLQWTSPGDDLDFGNVHSIELRADMQPEVLLSNFSNAFLYNNSFVTNGSLDPLPVGEVQSVTVIIPDQFIPLDTEDLEHTIYFAVKAIDKSNNVSPGFNMAVANFYTYKPKSDVRDKKDSFNWWPAVTGISIAILIMLILLIILIIIFHKRKNRKFEKVPYD